MHDAAHARFPTRRILWLACVWSLAACPLAAQDPLVGHAGAINTIIYNRSGTQIATGSSDQLIKLWDAKTQQEIRTLPGHTGQVLCLAVLPDDTTLISGSSDNSLRLWDIPRADPLHAFSGHTGAIHRTITSPNGRQAISVGADKLVYAWDLAQRKLLAKWEGHTAAVTRAAYRADNNLVATGDANGNIILWNVVTGQPQARLYGHTSTTSGLAFHPNNQQLVSTGHDGMLKVWQLPIVASQSLGEHETPVRSVALTSDAQSSIVSNGTAVQVFTTATGAAVRELAPGPTGVNHLTISANNAVVAGSSEQGVTHLWNLADGTTAGLLAGHQGPIHDVAFHPDNLRLATVGKDGTARIWQLPKPPVALAGMTQAVTSVDVSSDGQSAATASTDKSVRIFNTTTGAAIRALTEHEHAPTVVRFHPSAAELVTADEQGHMHFWNAADGTLQANVGAHTGPVIAAAYHPTGKLLATSGTDGSLKLWSLPTPPEKSLQGHTQPITAVAISADAKLAATASTDKSIRLFDATTNQPIRQLDATSELSALALSPDAQRITSGDAEGRVHVWLTADGSPWPGTPTAETAEPQLVPASLSGHDGKINAVHFRADGSEIVSAGADGTVRLWRLPTAPHVLPHSVGPTTQFAISPDGKLAATAGTHQSRPAVFIRNLSTGNSVHTLLGHAAPITSLAFAPNGKQLATGSADQSARIWDLTDAKFPELAKLDLPSSVSAVAFDSDAAHLFTATTDNTIRQWALADNSEVRAFTGHTAAIHRLVHHDTLLVSGAADNTVRVWNAATGAAVRSLPHGAAVADIAVSPDGKSIASAGADQAVKIWDVASGAAVTTLTGHPDAVIGLGFHSQSQLLASVSPTTVRLWDLESQQCLQAFSTGEWVANGVAFAAQDPADKPNDLTQLRLATAGADGTLRIYSPDVRAVLHGHTGEVTDLALTADGNRLASSGADKSVRLWNLDNHQLQGQFTGPTDAVTSVSIAANGTQLAAGSVDKNIYLWDVPDATAATAAPPPIAARDTIATETVVRTVTFGTQASQLATAGDDQQVRVWDVPSKLELQRFAGHQAAVQALAFAGDGTTILSGAADNEARLWSVSATLLASQTEGNFHDLAFSPQGNLLVALDDQPQPLAWPFEELTPGVLFKFPVPQPPLNAQPAEPQQRLAMQHQGGQFATLGESGRVTVWDIQTRTAVATLTPNIQATETPDAAPDQPNAAEAPTRPIGQLAFSQDDTRLAVGTGQQIDVYDLASQRRIERLPQPTPVTSLAFTTDAQNLVVGRLGTTNNAALEQTHIQHWLTGHEGPVTSVAFAPDGNALVTGGADKTVRKWNLADGKPICSYAGHEASVSSLTISPDGNHLVTGDQAGQALVWPLTPMPADAVTVEPALSIPHPAAIQCLHVSGDSSKLVTGTADSLITVWDLTLGHPLQMFHDHTAAVHSVAFGADNQTILSGSEDQTARTQRLAVTTAIPAHESAIHEMALFAAGAQVATAGADGTIRIWNLANGQTLRTFENESPIRSLAVRGDNAQLIAADDASRLRLWNLTNGEELTQFETPATVQQLSYSQDNAKIAAAMSDGVLRFYNPTDGSLLYELTSDQPLTTAHFTQDGRRVLSGDPEGNLRLWSYASPTARSTLTGHGGSVYEVAVSPDGTRIASASADATVRLWDAKSGTQLTQLTGHQGPVYNLAFSPDGALLVSCGADQSVRLWDVLGGRQLKQIPVSSASLYSVAFHTDGKRVLTSGLDKKIYLLDALQGTLQQTLEDHQDYVYRVAFNQQGNRMLSCGYGGNIVIWNAANGQKLFTQTLGGVANDATYSPNGEHIVVAGGDGKAHFITLPPQSR